MPEPSFEFDASRGRTTIELHQPPSAEAIATIAARLRTDKPRSVHIIADLLDRWEETARLRGLFVAPVWELEDFIFDTPYASVGRQCRNTLGDIGDVLDACPGLQRAFVTGCSTMRRTRHAHLHELYLAGSPLDPSVIPALAASQLPALEKLVLSDEARVLPPAALAEALRSIDAPRLAQVSIDGADTFEFLPIIGNGELQWGLCICDPNLDEVDELCALLAKHEALCSGRLQLCSDVLFDSEIGRLADLGVAVMDSRESFPPCPYRNW